MKLQNHFAPENSPLRFLRTTMKPENSSMLWATNYYLVCWHHSQWENCGHLELLPALCQPCRCTEQGQGSPQSKLSSSSSLL